MTLSYIDVIMLSSSQEEKVSSDEIKMIYKKSGEKALKIFFTVFSVISFTGGVLTVIFDKEFPLFYLLVFIFFSLPMTIDSFKKKEVYACYGVVVDKTVRCAKLSGKTICYLPFEKTVEAGTYKHRITLTETVYDYYYCNVEIDGQIYENVCCKDKDFKEIDIGERIIIANDDIYRIPVVYKFSDKTK